jgi:predicted Zn-dependent protease
MQSAMRAALAVALVVCLVAQPLRPVAALTIKEEEELSRQIVAKVLELNEQVKDPVVNACVLRVGGRILDAVGQQPFNYEFFVLKDTVYNAFATPAGKIFISSALIAAMESEEELAGILSHEIAHVVCRHISQKVERSKKIAIATLAGLAAGIFLGAGGAAAVGQALGVGAMAAGRAAELAYSREDEMQADQIGLKYLTQAGYSGEGLLRILHEIRSKRWYDSKQVPTYLSTHPAVEDRITYIDSWLERQNRSASLPEPVESYQFIKARNRLVALYGDESYAVRFFQSALQDNPSDPMLHYGYGLLLARTSNWPKAEEHLQQVLAQRPFEPDVLSALGQVYFQQGRYQQARQALQGALSVDADQSQALFFLGRTEMELGRLDTAESLLRRAAAGTFPPPHVYYFLGKLCGQKGDLVDAHYYLGIHYQQEGQHKAAEVQLRKALELTRDPQRRQQIEARLKELGQGGNRS